MTVTTLTSTSAIERLANGRELFARRDGEAEPMTVEAAKRVFEPIIKDEKRSGKYRLKAEFDNDSVYIFTANK